MRIAAHHRSRGDSVLVRRAPASVERRLWDQFDRVYASLIFKRTRALAHRLLRVYPEAVIGGTGWDLAKTLEDEGIATKKQDYSDFPAWHQSIGFTQRGCRLRCPFCVVPVKEGRVTEEQTIREIWRGDPWPRQVILLDNDFFGQAQWRERIEELNDGGFEVSFNQGINARMLTPETAKAIASTRYRDDGMKRPCVYTAWDNRGDERRLLRGLELLAGAGVNPRAITVYMLIGYWPGESHADRDYRRRKIREFGAFPYPMPYERTQEMVGFQRWVIGHYDKRVPWDLWKSANYRPELLNSPECETPSRTTLAESLPAKS